MRNSAKPEQRRLAPITLVPNPEIFIHPAIITRIRLLMSPVEKSHAGLQKMIGITFAFILAIVIFIAVDPFSPSVSINPLNLCFTVDDGLNPPPQILEIGSSREAVTWSATDDAQWLDLDPVSGNTGEETSITLSADISELYPDEYAATVTICVPDARNIPLEVPVDLIITETQETLTVKRMVGANTNEVEIHYNEQPPYAKTFRGERIQLINNKVE